MKVSFNRTTKLIEQASIERSKKARNNEKFDVISAIEFGMPWRNAKFTLDILSKSDWSGLPEEDAFVEFSPTPHLVLREEIYDAARRGDPSSVFTLAHELAHLHLHGNVAARRLARAAHTAFIDRTNEREEKEANIYAGALLIHYPSIGTETTVWELKLRYGVSEEVARRAISQRIFGRYI